MGYIGLQNVFQAVGLVVPNQRSENSKCLINLNARKRQSGHWQTQMNQRCLRDYKFFISMGVAGHPASEDGVALGARLLR
jgi:hypothetical protein